jgi:small subunit ribosomal protein S4e
MARNHLKRIEMPVTWTSKEKKKVYWIARPNPGAHKLDKGMPLVLVLREILGYASSAREAKQVLNNKNVLVDGIRRKDHRFNVGFMDVISVPELKESYRISLNKYGKLNLVRIDEKESKEKICKIHGKGLYRGKTQLRLSDGRNALVDKGNYKTSDSVVISVPDQKITKHISFEKGATVLLTKGRKIGTIGTVQEVKLFSEQNVRENQEDVVIVKSGNETFETLMRYCFVIGKQKPEVKIE